MSFCDYCGDDILNEEDKSIQKESVHVYHRNCVREQLRCHEAVRLFRSTYSHNGRVLSMSMAIHVNYLYGLKKGVKDEHKKLKRSRKLDELGRIVSALRNSQSGQILIHLVGLAAEDTYTGCFDEFADRKLQDLIFDGSLFTKVYKKQRLSEIAAAEANEQIKASLEGFTDFLVLYVHSASHLSTSNFNTKLANDDRIIDATDSTVFRFLTDKENFKETFPLQKKTLKEVLSLQESRSVQFKGYFRNNDRPDAVKSLFQNKIVEYISAFTKCENGGSYFLGVAEIPNVVNGRKYETKILQPQAVHVSDRKQVEEMIKIRVRDTVLVCDYDGKEIPDADIVQVYFVPVHEASDDYYVVCVTVKPVRGIVFCNKDGPLAYKVVSDTDTEEERIETDTENINGNLQVVQFILEEWFTIFMKRAPVIKGK